MQPGTVGFSHTNDDSHSIFTLLFVMMLLLLFNQAYPRPAYMVELSSVLHTDCLLGLTTAQVVFPHEVIEEIGNACAHTNLNPVSNAEATFIQSTRMQRSKPCHSGIYWIALTEYFQMSTNVLGF